MHKLPLAILACFGATCLAVRADAVPIDRYVTIQPIRVCDTAGAICAAATIDEALIDKIYAQAGTDLIFLPTRTLNDSGFLTTTVESLAPTRIDEWRQLTRGAASAGVRSANATTLNVFFVNNIVDATGVSGSSIRGVSFINGNGVVISNATAVTDTLAHELSHNLGLDHQTFGNAAEPTTNLMTRGGLRQVPASIGDIAPTGAQLDQLNALQIAKIRDPLFSVGTNVARAEVQGSAGDTFRRIVVRVTGPNPAETVDKLKVWWPAGTVVAADFRLNVDALIAAGCPAPCVVSSQGLLVDGTVQAVFEFPDGGFKPGTGISFIPLSPGGSGFFTPIPFSFSFEFDSGLASQAALDAVTLTASSDDPGALRSFLRDPTYGPPAETLPEPDGFAAHSLADEAALVPAPATIALLAASLGALATLRRRALTRP